MSIAETGDDRQALRSTVYPYKYYTEGWGQKLIVDYSADWLIKKLGMWVTFFVQQTLFDWGKNYVDPDPDVADVLRSDLTGGVVTSPPRNRRSTA